LFFRSDRRVNTPPIIFLSFSFLHGFTIHCDLRRLRLPSQEMRSEMQLGGARAIGIGAGAARTALATVKRGVTVAQPEQEGTGGIWNSGVE